MQLASISNKFAGGLVALALCTSSTGAFASTAHMASQSSISPLVALSALGSEASQTALCGAAAAAAAGAAAVAQAATPGCVLPVTDSVSAPLPVAEALPPPPVAPPPVPPVSEGFGISPILLALVAVAAGVGLYFLLKKKHHNSPA
jgi:hypothetical protein